MNQTLDKLICVGLRTDVKRTGIHLPASTESQAFEDDRPFAPPGGFSDLDAPRVLGILRFRPGSRDASGLPDKQVNGSQLARDRCRQLRMGVGSHEQQSCLRRQFRVQVFPSSPVPTSLRIQAARKVHQRRPNKSRRG